MKRKLLHISLFILLFQVTPVLSQTDSEFWFAVPKVTSGHDWNNKRFFFRFANLSLANEITISMPANPLFTPIVRNLAPNEAAEVDVTDIISQLWTENPNQVFNRGIRISATNLTTAYFEVGTNNNPDIFSLKGRNALGTEFFVPFQDHFDNGNYSPQPYSGIYIVATEDNTRVTVTPTQPVFPGRPAGVPFEIILNRGETYAVVPDNYGTTGQAADKHLGGTQVVADKPVAISTSDDSVGANPYYGCRDLIGDQIVPTTIIGSEYIAMKGRLGTGNQPNMPEYFYIVGTKPNTQVYIDGNIEVFLQPGEQFRWKFIQTNHHIKTSEPVYVYHVAGFGCEMGGAILPPIDVCTGSTKVSFTRSIKQSSDLKNGRFFVNILVRAGAEDAFVLNGNGPNTIIKASDFKTVPGTVNWLAAEFEFSAENIIPTGKASLIENTKDVFHLGIINGGPTSGTMYGYFSDFNELDIKANISGTGTLHKACIGEPIQLIAQGGVRYQWSPPDFLDDPTSATPIALPEKSIKYTVTVSGACKMTDSTTVFVSLYGPANAAFTVDKAEGCTPLTVNINNESFGISRYSWRMGDGTVYTTAAEEFSHTYINTTDSVITRKLELVGWYSLCQDRMETTIKIYPEVKAKVQADVTEGCSPLTVNFTNLSTGADKFLWSFGDGSTSNSKDASYEFINLTGKAQTHTIHFTATSPSGCVSDTSFTVVVYPFVETDFTFDPSAHCSPYPVVFKNTTYGAVTNLWSFDGGENFENIPQPEFSHVFNNNGDQPVTHTIILNSENYYGCKDTQTRQLTVYPAIQADFITDAMEGCNPLPVNFTNQSMGGHTFVWEFDQHMGSSSEVNPSVIFDNQSYDDTLSFQIKLTATSQWFCKSEITKEIKVYPRIKADFTFDYTSFCTPQEITFFNNSQGATTYSWNFGNGATSQSSEAVITQQYINGTGLQITFPVELQISNQSGCTDKITREVVIYPQVKADFAVTTSGCHPLEVTLENKSNGAAKYLWTLGDGGYSRDEQLTRVYTNNGHVNNEYYTIQLLAESQYGCKDSVEQVITVYPKPYASYSLSESYGCAPISVNFESSSQGAARYFWQFGDDNTHASYQANVSHTYNNTGELSETFISRLVAISQYGCKDTTERGIEVFPEINAQFALDATSGCHPLELQISNLSTGASAASPYQWHFDDGNKSTAKESVFSHTFNNFSHTQLQQYNLSLKAESLYGCKDSTQVSVTVYPTPESVFEPSVVQGCSPLPVNFEDKSTGATSYNWSFGDGSVSYLKGTTSHVYHQAYNMGEGLYKIGLMVENNYGCSDSTYRQVTVFPDITAEFSNISEGCHPLEVNFTNLSKGASVSNWEFGDGSVTSTTNPAYLFTNPSHVNVKEYTISLKTASVYGCNASATRVVTVFPKPTAEFTLSIDEGCAPLPVNITNASQGGAIFDWQFGSQEGHQGEKSFKYTFANQSDDPLTYNINLTSINEYGCFRESKQNLLVYPEVKAQFGSDNDLMKGCSPLDLEFLNHSARAHRYNWDFGDGNVSTLAEPRNTFYTPGTHESTYHIKLRAQSIYGCTDSITRQAQVYPVPMADMFVTPHEQDFPSNSIRIENLSSPGNWVFDWSMGDGTVITTDQWETLEHIFTWPSDDYSTKYYTVSLKTSNEFCQDTISQRIVINAPQPVVGFEPGIHGCPPLEIQFRNGSQYGLEFFWDFDDGNFSSSENPSHTFTEPGEYMVKLLVSGEGGIDSAYQMIKVFETPKANFRVAPDNVQLPYDEVQMINLSSMASYYEWHMGDGTIYYDAEPSHLYQQPGNYDIRLNVATNTFPQCHDSMLKSNAVVAEQGCQIIFPDAFTPSASGPNGGSYVINDPSNHVFYPVHTGIDKYQMEIFTRWGELIYRTTDINIGWDGYYRGRLSTMDVYVWKLKATCHSGKEIEAVGDVTLYR